jgi:hypothetical protein
MSGAFAVAPAALTEHLCVAWIDRVGIIQSRHKLNLNLQIAVAAKNRSSIITFSSRDRFQ